MKDNMSAKPNKTSSLDEWLYYLENIHPTTIELGLERANHVAMTLDILQPAPYIFTVAGTNGKGTTCRALEMILLAAGFRVGVYSSPHLLHYSERVRINNHQLADSEHVKAFDLIEAARRETSLTYFEYATLSALWLFKQACLDVVILEVGLGGRLDATNIVKADVAVITSIALDHTEYLGDTRESIGSEKAGIFKQNSVAIVGEPDIPHSIYSLAKEKSVQLHCCFPNPEHDWQYEQIEPNFWQFRCGNICYQRLPIPNIPLANAATALAALTYSSINVSRENIDYGLKQTALTGRFQVISHHPLVILDVAHNPHAAIYLNRCLETMKMSNSTIKKWRFVIGMLKDKDFISTIKALNADIWYCATINHERGLSAKILAESIVQKENAMVMTFESVTEAFEQAILDADKDDVIVVCGSFYTVSEVLGLVTNE